MQPLVSVIIPVYNAEKTLKRCVTSIQNQSINEIEIILVNDGSVDNSAKICDEFSKEDKRITVKHIENSGPANARNVGMAMAKGEYIGFVDADDYIDENMYKDLYSAVSLNASDIVLCSYNIISNDLLVTAPQVHKFGNNTYAGDEIKEKLLSKFYVADIIGLSNLWNKLYRRQFLQDNHLKIDEHLIRAEDYWFNFEAFMKAQGVTAVEKSYYYYVDTPGSIMHTFRETQFEDWVYNRKKLLSYNDILKFNIDEEQFYYRFIYNVSVYIMELSKRKNTKKINEILNNEFYLQAIKFDSKLPIHIRTINRMVKMRLKFLAKCTYKAWSLVSN